MAFKMKGAPMHDLSSKHGTNANYKKSGAPGLLGKILDPLGLKNRLMGGKGKPCPPAGQPQPAAPAPNAPAQPAAPAPAAAAPEEAAAAAPMKEGLMTRGTDPRKSETRKTASDKTKRPHLYTQDKKDPRKDTYTGPRSTGGLKTLTPAEMAKRKNKKKLKVGAPMKASPAKGIWDDIKSGASKAYDKASQIGMGLKGAIKAADVPVGSKTTFPGARSVKGFKKGYEREKKHDEAENKKNKKK